MKICFFSFDGVHPLSDGATRPIEPLATRLGALLLLALPFTHNYFHPELAEASANPAHIICKQA